MRFERRAAIRTHDRLSVNRLMTTRTVWHRFQQILEVYSDANLADRKVKWSLCLSRSLHKLADLIFALFGKRKRLTHRSVELPIGFL